MWWLHFMSARVGSPVRLGRGLWRGGSGLLALCHCPHCCDKNAWQEQPGRGRLYSGSWFQRVQFMYCSIGSCQREPKGERLHPWPPGSREKWSRRREPGPPTPIGLSKFWSHLWIKPLGQSSHAIISAQFLGRHAELCFIERRRRISSSRVDYTNHREMYGQWGFGCQGIVYTRAEGCSCSQDRDRSCQIFISTGLQSVFKYFTRQNYW